MFFVFNKQKIYSYIVALSTVIVLFGIAIFIRHNDNQLLFTSASINKKLPIYSVQTDENKVSLTINCAWNADDIDTILDTLSKQAVKVTFFMVGDWIEKYPDSVKKIYEAGHEIANHSDNHKHVNSLTYEQNVEEILNCGKKIESITKTKPTLYRGPYGEYNDTVVKAAEENGYKMIQWSLDTLDYNGLDGDQMWARLNNKITKGSIILMHNGTDHTADSLERIIINIKEKGFDIVPVSELIYKDNYEIDSNGMQKTLQNQ